MYIFLIWLFVQQSIPIKHIKTTKNQRQSNIFWWYDIQRSIPVSHFQLELKKKVLPLLSCLSCLKKSVPQRSIDWLTFEIATLIDFFFQWSHFSGKEEPTTKHKVSHCALSYFSTQIDVNPKEDKKARNNYIKMQSCHWKKVPHFRLTELKVRQYKFWMSHTEFDLYL